MRAKALIRWGYSLALPLVGPAYRRRSDAEMQVTSREEWSYVANTIGHTLRSLSRSLPADDVMRRVGPGSELVPELGMDLLPPTQEDLTIDPDFAAATDEAPAGTLVLLSAAARDSRGGYDTTSALIDLAGGDPDSRTPGAGELETRRHVVEAAGEAVRWLMWRRQSYLMSDDPNGIRTLLVWPIVMDRQLSTADSSFSDIIGQQEASLAIDRVF